jgi:hypothetical protein
LSFVLGKDFVMPNGLHRVGALWRPRPGSKSLGSGTITVNGLKQRFVVLRNDRKKEGSSEPDYLLMSGDEPEIDSYTSRRASSPNQPALAQDIPF